MASVTRQQTVVVSTGSWTNFTIAALATQDGTNAYNNVTSYTAGTLRGYDFQIPSGATINGVIVSVYFSASAANATAYLRARLSKDAGSNWSNYSTAASTNGTLSFDFGGATDLWGLSLSQSEVNNATNFYVSIEGYITATNRECRLDFVQVTVYYTEATFTLAASAMSGSASLAIAANTIQLSASAMSGSAALAVNTQILRTAEVLLGGNGTLAVSADVFLPAGLGLSGAGQLSLAAQKIYQAALTLSGQGILAANLVLVKNALIAFSSSGVIAIVTEVVPAGLITTALTLQGQGFIQALPQITTHVGTAFSASGAMAVNAEHHKTLLLSLTGNGSLILSAQRTQQGLMTFAGYGILTVTPREPTFYILSANGFVFSNTSEVLVG